jgi:signal transduction histidine kinase
MRDDQRRREAELAGAWAVNAPLGKQIRSLRTRLAALWLMLAISATVTGFVLLEFYRQSANAQVARADELVGRSCRELGDRFGSLISPWPDQLDDAALRQLTEITQSALASAQGVEGGIWQNSRGSLAYAYPTYEGTGPKTDVPEAELPTIRSVNAEALRSGRPITMRQVGRSQVLVVHACQLSRPLAGVTGWTMTRVFTGQGPAYKQLLAGLALLAITVVGSALWLGYILLSWSRKLRRLEGALSDHDAGRSNLPTLELTGEPELDRLVSALNALGSRLADAHRRAAAAERLAAVGGWAAGLAHEIRNPIAAMRLKAENALAAPDEGRRAAALKFILDQVGRLDSLLRDLMATTQPRPPQVAEADLRAFVNEIVNSHHELAAAKGIALALHVERAPTAPKFDASQVRSALDNLIHNAVQNTPIGGTVTVEAGNREGRLCLRVTDTGSGVPETIQDRLFEPFVTGRPEGTGLGLAIVREIARANGGEVRLLQKAGGGAAFELDLPWRPS